MGPRLTPNCRIAFVDYALSKKKLFPLLSVTSTKYLSAIKSRRYNRLIVNILSDTKANFNLKNENGKKSPTFEMSPQEARAFIRITNPLYLEVRFGKESYNSEYTALLDDATGKICLYGNYNWGGDAESLLKRYWPKIGEMDCDFGLLAPVEIMEPKKLDKVSTWNTEFMGNLATVLRISAKHMNIQISSFFHTNPLFLSAEDFVVFCRDQPEMLRMAKPEILETSPSPKHDKTQAKIIDFCEIDVFCEEDNEDIIKLVMRCCPTMQKLRVNDRYWIYDEEKMDYVEGEKMEIDESE